MSPRTAAAAAIAHAPTRPRTRPRPAPSRRRSGATMRPRTKARVAQPRVRVLPGIARPDGVALLDRVLRGPAYIAIVFVLLAGIVFFNVDVLELNHGIARTGVRATQLERQNAALTTQLAQLASSERIQSLAIQRGLVLPEPGDVRYLRANPGDATHALRIMTAPGTGTVTQGAPAQPTLVTQSSQPANQPPGTQQMTTPAMQPATAQPQPATTQAATPTQPGTVSQQPTANNLPTANRSLPTPAQPAQPTGTP